MTDINFTVDRERFVFDCRGHAGTDGKGNDIVCAGISALCIALAVTLKALEETGNVFLSEFGTDDALLHISGEYAGDGLEKIRTGAAMITVLNGLTEIEKMYPGHLRVMTDYTGD